MKYRLNYGTEASTIPSSVSSILDRAGLCDLKTLIYLSTAGGECEAEDISSAIDCPVDEVNMSLAFLRGAGVVVSDSQKKTTRSASKKTEKKEEATKETEEKKPFEAKVKARPDKLPEYTAKELAGILEKRDEVALLIAEGQNILGKIFTVHEVNLLIGLSDYLGLENDFIIMLLKHCAEMGKKTLHYVEKTAISLYDMGITTVGHLSAELERREALSNMEGHIRRIFGLGTRNLTTKEKREISSWVNDMKCPVEVIEKAYEVTCDATGKPSLHYANSVIERWHAERLLTIDQIEASYKNKDAADTGSSFETDEFFEAAVRRSLGEK